MLTMVGGSDEGGWSESTLAWSCRWCSSRVVRYHLLPCRSAWVHVRGSCGYVGIPHGSEGCWAPGGCWIVRGVLAIVGASYSTLGPH
jgi:hypothetical protein